MNHLLRAVLAAILTAVSLLALTSSPAHAAPDPIEVIYAGPDRTIATYAYAGNSDPSQTVDVYYDPGQTGKPCMFVVHGGSWAAGNKQAQDFASRKFEGEGFVVFNVEYRKTTDYSWAAGVPWSVQRDDVYRAIAWGRANAVAFGAVGTRCAIYGFSAGGHLAVTAAFSEQGLRAVVSSMGALQPSRIWMVANSDLPDGYQGDLPTAANRTLSGWAAASMRCPFVSWTDCAQRWRDFDPTRQIDPADPPILMFSGTEDQSVPSGTAKSFRYWMAQEGIPCQITAPTSTGQPCLIEAAWGHTEWLAFDGGWREEKMMAFLKAETR